jgi:hypothetical protein
MKRNVADFVKALLISIAFFWAISITILIVPVIVERLINGGF